LVLFVTLECGDLAGQVGFPCFPADPLTAEEALIVVRFKEADKGTVIDFTVADWDQREFAICSGAIVQVGVAYPAA